MQMNSLDLLDLGGTRSRAMASIARTLRFIIQVATLGAGTLLAMEQEITPGAMIAASIIVGRLLMPFDHVVETWRQWVTGDWQLASAFRPCSRKILPCARRCRRPRPHGDLIVDKLVYAAPGVEMPIIKGISFSLSPGEVLGIVGPSAAGKSTLARLMIGIVKPTSGGVFLDGNNVYLWERGSFGEIAGYLPQSVALLEGTIQDNIARMGDGDPHRVLEAARLADVHEMIGRLPLGYDTPVGDGRLTLSGGQRQRIGLARCLYNRPRLIVLDEPNANLDAVGERALMRAIEQARDDGAIVVMIAHRPTIMQVADKLLVLEERAHHAVRPAHGRRRVHHPDRPENGSQQHHDRQHQSARNARLNYWRHAPYRCGEHLPTKFGTVRPEWVTDLEQEDRAFSAAAAGHCRHDDDSDRVWRIFRLGLFCRTWQRCRCARNCDRRFEAQDSQSSRGRYPRSPAGAGGR